jgi:hypothetical protein
MKENVTPAVIAPNEPVSLCVIEPLHDAFYSFHGTPFFFARSFFYGDSEGSRLTGKLTPE